MSHLRTLTSMVGHHDLRMTVVPSVDLRGFGLVYKEPFKFLKCYGNGDYIYIKKNFL